MSLSLKSTFIYPFDVCACGHGLGDHFFDLSGCEICADKKQFYKHKFTTDNLDFVEEIAKKRNLV